MSGMTQLRWLLGPLAALFVALGMPALAQDNPFAPSGTGSVSISASNVSANVALPANTPVVLICNAGTVNAFFKAGVGNTTTATASNFILLPGLCQTLNVASQTYIAAITSSGTTTVWITQGRGNPEATPGALGSSGISLSGSGANNADAVPSVATGLSSADVYNFIYNGTTWDRARGDTTNGAWVNVKASALPSNAAQEGGGNLATIATQNTAINTLLGLQADAACATDNGTCTLEALVKRLNQRLTTLNTTLGSPFQAGGSIGNTGFIANAGTNLNTSALALDATLGTTNTDLGAPGATACATDTGSCSLNALLQRLAQRLSTLITGPLPTTLPAAPTDAAGNGVIVNPSTEALAGIVPVVTTALESNHVICAAACNFYGGYITTGATAGWLLLANATSAPTAAGAAIAPIACVLAPANQTTSISGPSSAPIRGSTGIVMVFSTSGCLTNTASTTAFFSGQAK